MKTFYTYDGTNNFYIYDVVFAEKGDIIVIDENTITNISKTNRKIMNCPKEIANNLLSKCLYISQ